MIPFHPSYYLPTLEGSSKILEKTKQSHWLVGFMVGNGFV